MWNVAVERVIGGFGEFVDFRAEYALSACFFKRQPDAADARKQVDKTKWRVLYLLRLPKAGIQLEFDEFLDIELV